MTSIIEEKLNMFDTWVSIANLNQKEYQRDGVRQMLEKELCQEPYNECRGGILADEMGLGKTIQILGLLYSNLVERTLIVLPVSLLEQWETEIIRLLGHRPLVYHGQRKYEKPVEKSMIVLTTYGTLATRQKGVERILSPLTKYDWGRVIYDEGHHLRNRKTMSFHGAKNIRSTYTWILTGTPVQNNFRDLYSLFLVIGLQEYYFKCNLKDAIKHFIIKRTKQEVGLDLPDIHIHTILIDWVKEENQVIGSLCQYKQNMFGTGENNNVCPIGIEEYEEGDEIQILPCGHNFKRENIEGWLNMFHTCPLCRKKYNVEKNIEKEIARDIHSQINFTNITNHNVNYLIQMLTHHHLPTMVLARQICILPSMVQTKIHSLTEAGITDERLQNYSLNKSAKMDKLLSLLNERKDNGNRKIIFCHYIKEIEFIERKITQEIPYLNTGIICGNVKKRERNDILMNMDLHILLMQVDSCCEGLNLQHFNEIYFTSPHWNPYIEDQAIARAHRIGQTKPVEVFRLEMEGFGNDSISLDNYTRMVQEKKREYELQLEEKRLQE